MEKLRGGIIAAFEGFDIEAELHAEYTQFVARCSPPSTESLADKLDEATNATNPATRAKLVEEARAINPSNNKWRNLRSLCQRCHLVHDRPYHRAQRWITYRRRYATGDLFLGFYAPSHIGGDATEIAPDAEAVASALSVMRAFVPRPSEADHGSTNFANPVLSSRTQSFGPVELLI